jgi:predicted RNA-binding protein with RPS1 domain
MIAFEQQNPRDRVIVQLTYAAGLPWRQMVRNFPIGALTEGKVTKLVSFGAFVELSENVEGLVHISEMATRHIESPAQVVHVGDVVNIKIQDIDNERRRISLSMKAAAEILGIEIEVAEADPSMIKPKSKSKKERAAAAADTLEDVGENAEDAIGEAVPPIAADDTEPTEPGVEVIELAESEVALVDQPEPEAAEELEPGAAEEPEPEAAEEPEPEAAEEPEPEAAEESEPEAAEEPEPVAELEGGEESEPLSDPELVDLVEPITSDPAEAEDPE